MTPIITDHVIIRWLERVHGIDLTRFREEIAVAVQPFIDLRAQHAVHGPFWIQLDGAKVITVLEHKPKVKATAQHDRGGVNGTDQRSGPMHWKAQQRRRGHK